MQPPYEIDAEFDRVAELGDDLLLQINAIREVAPVLWSNRAQAWIVTRHADLIQAYSGKLPFSNVRYHAPYSKFSEEERVTRFPESMRTLPYWPVFTDPPLHTRLRKLLTRAFGRTVVEDLRPLVRSNIAEILDRAGAKRDIEFVNDVARAITGRTILHLLGMSDDNLEKLEKWSSVTNTALGSVSPPDEMLSLLESDIIEMRGLFEQEIARRRQHPTEDFISQMVTTRDGPDALTDDEIVGVCFVVLLAGHDTTMNSLSLSTIALANYPDARRYMMDHPESITNSVMEVSRFIAMSTMQPRIVSEDFEWHDEKLKKGQLVFLMIAGANRDPRVFSNPEVLDMTRNTDQVLVFGTGIHHCIGHLLAKMQLGEFLPELFRRFEVEIMGCEFSPSLSQRGPARLDIRFAPRQEGFRNAAE